MNPKEMNMGVTFIGFDSEFPNRKQLTLEELKLKHDSIKQNIIDVDHMDLSDKTKGLAIIELTQELFDIKCKVHKLIDEM